MTSVCVLLCTKNGERFIEAQLNSIINQKNINLHLYVSDDYSTDSTLNILNKYKRKFSNKIRKIYIGKRGSAVKNFTYLIQNIRYNYDYYAFSDQDDIWKKNKLHKAVNILKKGYALYCSRTILIDEDEKQIGLSPYFNNQITSFNHAFVQSIAGGNTMVFDKNVLNYLKTTLRGHFPSHDWWTYIITTFCGKKVYYDDNCSIYYRQHKRNLVGHNQGLINKFKRFYRAFFKNIYLKWNGIHLIILNKHKNLGTDKNQDLLNELNKLRKKNLINKIKFMYRRNIFRQSMIGNVVLFFLVLLKKF